jgi:hypothetical protein
MLRSDTLQITPEILNLIARIDEFKGAWRALGTLAPDRLSALRRVATIESIGSSTRIEGSKLSDREVEKLLSNLAIESFKTRDEQEVVGYAELMDLVFSSWRDIPFNENHVKQLHQILLRHSEKDSRHRGQYKANSNSVAAFDENGVQIAIVFETASPALRRSFRLAERSVAVIAARVIGNQSVALEDPDAFGPAPSTASTSTHPLGDPPNSAQTRMLPAFPGNCTSPTAVSRINQRSCGAVGHQGSKSVK